ncbi:MAG: hypothetical protein IPK15_06765 [Verrucomicrobia bacterium]|nr:hypothetical protein [Verrucomicrobiota bacterium]
MRTLLIALAGVSLVAALFAAEPRAAKPVATSKLTVLNEGGVNLDLPAGRIVFRDAVKVFESDLYMECELLTLFQQTNAVAKPAATATSTNLSIRPDVIIAETNLMMMARGTTIIGDRAVYTTSNETVVVTGDLVVIERSNVVFFSTNFVFNRLTSSGYAVGWTATEIEVSGGFSGTNALRPGFGPPRRQAPPAAPKPDGAK